MDGQSGGRQSWPHYPAALGLIPLHRRAISSCAETS